MKVIFMGTGPFAIPSLKALMTRSYEIVAVITQPDRARDRKGNIIEGELKKFAVAAGLKVLQFEKIKMHAEEIGLLHPDFSVTASYGQILSKEILDIAPVYNVHASLLPKYRGSSPINWAIINGENKTGITIMKTDLGLDTGDILSTYETPIGENETFGELFDRLKEIGAQLLMDTLIELEKGKIIPVKQSEKNVSKCPMITSETAEIDWNATNNEIFNLIRGLSPKPGAYTFVNDAILKILISEKDNSDSIGAGKIEILGKQLRIGCGLGNLIIKKLQPSGKKEMLVEEFINGNRGINGIVCNKRKK